MNPLELPRARAWVDDLDLQDDVPNTGSIESSLDEYRTLRGIREMPFTLIDWEPEINARTEALAAAINEAKQIKPLIIVFEAKYVGPGENDVTYGEPYVLEGRHRASALQILGYKTFPALVVIDERDLYVKENPPRRFPSKAPRAPLKIEYPVGMDLEVARGAARPLQLWIAGATRREIQEGLRADSAWKVYNASNRFEFHLDSYEPKRKGYGSRPVHTFRLVPKGGKLAREVNEWGDVRERKVYKAPKRGFDRDTVQRDPRLVYRGMCWEEWQFIRHREEIRSRGDYNLGNAQSGLTFWGTDPGTAFAYAGGFAPWPFQPGHERPGVVLAIDVEHTISSVPNVGNFQVIPEGERATVGGLSMRKIEELWLVVPTEINVMRVDLEHQHDPRYPEEVDATVRGGGMTTVAIKGDLDELYQ